MLKQGMGQVPSCGVESKNLGIGYTDSKIGSKIVGPDPTGTDTKCTKLNRVVGHT